MRPRGEIRQALAAAAGELAAVQGGAHWREMAMRACVGFAAAKTTVRDMVRAGELGPVGVVRTAHARRPMTLLAPTTRPVETRPAPQRLDELMQRWASR